MGRVRPLLEIDLDRLIEPRDAELGRLAAYLAASRAVARPSPDLEHATVCCGQFMAEEAPGEVVAALRALLART